MPDYTPPQFCGICSEPESLCGCDNVIMWPGKTLLALNPSRIAAAAQKADLKLCIIVGVDKHGELYFASTEGDLGMVLWQLERAKQELFKVSE